MATKQKQITINTSSLGLCSEMVKRYAFKIGICPDCFFDEDIRSDLITKEIDGEPRKVCPRCNGVVYIEGVE